jgi:hypothetical protein
MFINSSISVILRSLTIRDTFLYHSVQELSTDFVEDSIHGTYGRSL